MRASEVLFSQGFGSRRECAALLASGAVRVAGRVLHDANEDLPTEGMVLDVNGQPWPYHARALLMLHKPAGVECSRQPRHHPSVLALLPLPLRQRGVQPVGRLDADTTGLLLLTNDGAAIHRLTHPKHHVSKVYEVGTVHPVTDELLAALLAGVVLHDDPTPARALACVRTAGFSLRLTLAEGRYHQVKRMVAAAGNRVETLHRSAFGTLRLPADLPAGAWRWLTEAQAQALGVGGQARVGKPAPAQPLARPRADAPAQLPAASLTHLPPDAPAAGDAGDLPAAPATAPITQ